MQIIRGNYYRNISEHQRTNTAHERAPRGLIYDTNGKIIVNNIPNYVVLFYPFEQQYEPTEESIEKLSKILQKDIKSSIEKSWRYGRVIKLADNLTIDEVFKIQENKLFLPGITVVTEPKRKCYDPVENAHVIGYVNELRNEELDNMENTELKVGDIVGRCGVEQSYDKYLRGKDGGFSFEVNARGQHQKAFNYEPPIVGNSLFLTIDADLQKTAYEALQNSSSGKGAVVAIDVRTGAIKAFVSCPSYDLNKVSSAKEYARYLKNKNLPFFNRCIQALYPPGSTFKIVTFIAALEHLHYDPYKIKDCEGRFELGDRVFACSSRAGHKRLNLISAMAYSCNVYFYILGLDLGVKVIDEYAKKFNLGEKTGIDISSEKKGFVPTPDWKKARTKVPWLKGDTVILSIGQGALWVTPLQMANLMAIVANKGVSYKPYLVEEVKDSVTNETLYKHELAENEKIEIGQNTWKHLHKALESAVDYGTARRTKFKNLSVAAKTGTAENPQGEDHAWVVAYAPADNPELALAVIVENGGFGGSVSVPVAKEVLKKYFNIVEEPEEDLSNGNNNDGH
jgi:penicillin-binding protein 2